MRLAGLSVLMGCASSLVFVLLHLAFDLTSPGKAALFPPLMIGWPLQPFVGALGLLIGPLFLTWYGGFLRATHTPLPAALTAFFVWAAFFTCMAYGWLRRRRSASGEAWSSPRSSLRTWATILLGFSAILVVSEGFGGAEGCKSGERLSNAFAFGVPPLLVAGFYWLFRSGRSGDVVTFFTALAFTAIIVGFGFLGVPWDDTVCGPKGGEGSIVLMMCTLLIQLAWMSFYGIRMVIESRRSTSLRR